MEQAIQTAARRKYGQEHQIVAEVDRKTGDIGLYRDLEVAEEIARSGDPDRARGRARAQSGGADRRPHPGAAAADRSRPHRGAERQAGDRAEGARGRARAPVQRVQGPDRRDRGRRGQAHRVRQRAGRSRPRRGDPAPRRDAAARDRSATRIGCAPTSTTSGPRRAARRSSCRAPIRSSWRSLFAQEVPEIYDGIIEIKVGRPRSGLARQDRGGLQGQQHRPGRRLRRHARLARAGGGATSCRRREDRHHPLVAGSRDLRGQCPGAGRGQQGGARRGEPSGSR